MVLFTEINVENENLDPVCHQDCEVYSTARSLELWRELHGKNIQIMCPDCSNIMHQDGGAKQLRLRCKNAVCKKRMGPQEGGVYMATIMAKCLDNGSNTQADPIDTTANGILFN